MALVPRTFRLSHDPVRKHIPPLVGESNNGLFYPLIRSVYVNVVEPIIRPEEKTQPRLRSIRCGSV